MQEHQRRANLGALKVVLADSRIGMTPTHNLASHPTIVLHNPLLSMAYYLPHGVTTGLAVEEVAMAIRLEMAYKISSGKLGGCTLLVILLL